jgi:hypothetical protein
VELSEINDKLIKLPGEIASKEKELEIAKVDTRVAEAIAMDRAEGLSSQDLRRAKVDLDDMVVTARKKEGILRSEYHGLINAFQGIQELARNTRQEMKSLKDGM